MQLQLLRSATLKLRYAGHTLLVDPWLAERGTGRSYAGVRRSPLVDLPIPVTGIVGDIDAVFVSHLHSDHFDDAAKAALRRGVRILCPERDAAAIAADGFTNVQSVAPSLGIGRATLTLTGGRHGPPAVLAEMGEVSGFVLEAAGEPTLYWVGDSILCDEVLDAVTRYRPGIVVVHACGAAWGPHQPLVMDAPMVRDLLSAAPAVTVIATHMEAVDHATVSRADLRSFIDREAPGGAARLLIPANGETLSFG